MSEENIHKDEIVKAKKKRFKLNLKFNRKYTPLIIIFLAIPVTVSLVLVSQEIRGRATGSDIARVEVSPGNISTYTPYVGRQPYPTSLSALAYDSAGYPIHGGVEYSWSLSSTTSTVGTLTSTQGKISQFIPLKLGCAQLTVTASANGQQVTKAVAIDVSDGNTYERPSCISIKPTPVSWVTEHVSLTADDLTITANGKTFKGNDPSVKISSYGPFPPKMDNAQIDVWWNENNVPMRLLINFIREADQWKARDIRSYDGRVKDLSDWVYYDDFYGGKVGEAFVSDNFIIKSNSKTTTNATVEFKNLRLEPFLVKIPDTGYYIYRTQSSIPASQGSGYHFYGLLFKDDVFVTDQRNLEYIWKTDNNEIYLSTEAFCHPPELLTPCPNHYAAVSVAREGIKGLIYLTIKDKSTGNEIVQTTFGVNQPAPALSVTPSPDQNATILKFNSVKLHGIGSGGDNTNPNSPGNQNPLIKVRELVVETIDSAGNTYAPVKGKITFNDNSGAFSGDIALDANTVYDGSYLVKVKSPQYLKKQLTGILTITKGSVTSMPSVTLTTGDINNDNAITINDYNILIGCYSDLLPAKNCDTAKKAAADLTSDNNVNADDYNLFLRELSNLSGN